MPSNIEITTPVLFLIFNRPDATQRVFNVIREAKPSKLFVAADGPRANKPEDELKCSASMLGEFSPGGEQAYFAIR